MHKFLLPIIASLSIVALSGCGTPEDDPLATNCLVERTSIENFTLCMPDGWLAITTPFGNGGNYTVKIQPLTGTGGAMDMHVKKDPLNQPVSSVLEFAERAVEIARETAPNYEVISTDPIVVDGDETILHIFEAKPEEAKIPVRYHQFVTIHDGIAYGFTGILHTGGNEQLEEVLQDVFTNVQFVE